MISKKRKIVYDDDEAADASYTSEELPLEAMNELLMEIQPKMYISLSRVVDDDEMQ